MFSFLKKCVSPASYIAVVMCGQDPEANMTLSSPLPVVAAAASSKSRDFDL